MPNIKLLISGLAGVGKNAVQEKLSKELNLVKFSAGEIMRIEAKKAFPLEENPLNLFEELIRYKGNYEIDRLIDEKTQKLLLERTNFILDSRIAWYFAKKMNSDAVRISLTASPSIRYQRIADREKISFDKAKKDTSDREEEIKVRFKKLYDINFCELSNPQNFHFSVNTDIINEKMVSENIINFLEKSNIL
ncbi:MAG: CMP/dCMP kinase [Patescibacteria group bacterium]|nr:CMP/dCMP kinase [Patescibacteria group bacterium]